MKPQWHPEFKITSEMAGLLIKEQFPELSPVTLQCLGDGWDNSAFLVNNIYVFRFPRRHVAVELLETENLILPKIASYLNIPIPVPLFIGKPSAHFPWPFSGYSFIPGITACRAGLTMRDRIKLALQIAMFLKSLHSIPLEYAVTSGAEPDKIGRLDLNKHIPKLYNYLDFLSENKVIIDRASVIKLVESIDIEVTHKRLTLVHGDFYMRHILVDRGYITGIIDWGDIHTGNPAIDISIAPGFLPEEGRRVFTEVYGEIDKQTWHLAKFKALNMAIILMAYGYDTGDINLLKEAETSLSLLLQ
ncbi:MAG: phosphotransferase [Candidatus Eremiobacterota bacterium]